MDRIEGSTGCSLGPGGSRRGRPDGRCHVLVLQRRCGRQELQGNRPQVGRGLAR
ncbi:unnamed protein product [Ectocarpus fasciculatus]